MGFADGVSADRSRPERSPSRLSPPPPDVGAAGGGRGTWAPCVVGGACLPESDPVLWPMDPLLRLSGSKSSSSSANMSSESSSSAITSSEGAAASESSLTSTGAGVSETEDCK